MSKNLPLHHILGQMDQLLTIILFFFKFRHIKILSKMPGLGADHPPPPNSEVKERVEL
jgi:hypothetical protein